MQSLLGFFDQLRGFSIGGNTAYEYVGALALFFAALFVLKFFQVVMVSKLRSLSARTRNEIDNAVIALVSQVRSPLYVLFALFISIRALELHEVVIQLIDVLFIITVVYEAVRAINGIVDFLVQRYASRSKDTEVNQEAKKHAESMARTMRLLVQIVVWIIGVLMVLANLGVNVTSIVASLGIGGLAVAFALQNVFSDLFSSFSIYVDKPFKVGDFIIVGDDKGTVERIGMKSTRIRTLQGEQLIISNQELTSTRVQNFKHMERRRTVIEIGVEYGTSVDMLGLIPQLVNDIIDAEEEVTFDRCHLSSFGDYSVHFETVFYVESSDYTTFMDKKEHILLAIYTAFEKKGIAFAFPTQTIHMRRALQSSAEG